MNKFITTYMVSITAPFTDHNVGLVRPLVSDKWRPEG